MLGLLLLLLLLLLFIPSLLTLVSALFALLSGLPVFAGLLLALGLHLLKILQHS